MAGVTALAVVLLVHAVAVDDPLFASSTVRPPATAELSPHWIERVAAKVLPSLVTLQVSDGDRSELGSGVILGADGLILTNDHVVAALKQDPQESARTLVMLNDGRTAAFDVVGSDPQSDIAVVRTHDLSGLTPISVGSSDALRVGQPVVAVGSPLGLDGTVTDGIISALNRPVCRRLITDNGWMAYNAIQTDAAINPGNSGGALVDVDGRLIGINSAEAGLGDAESSGAVLHGSIGLGFAIPVDNALRIAAELVATGRASHGWLGAQVSDEMTIRGARIVEVTPGSPAAAARLTPGAVVTQVDDQVIATGNALVAATQSRPPGSSVALVFRDTSGRTKTVNVRLGTDQGRE
jgi:putative serine protease PepD